MSEYTHVDTITASTLEVGDVIEVPSLIEDGDWILADVKSVEDAGEVLYILLDDEDDPRECPPDDFVNLFLET